jgi:uncharacterized LabA/DUF88 family protein
MNSANPKSPSTVYAFIDASNLWEVQKAKGRLLDYRKLSAHLATAFQGATIRVFFYSAYPDEGTRDYDLGGRHKFYTFLRKGLGFDVITKALKQINVRTDCGMAVKEKGNMDVEMTIDAIHNRDGYDIAVFFSGDSDFLALITYLRNAGKQVHVYSSENNVSTELKTGGDGYVDVLDIQDDVWGDEIKHRQAGKPK